MAKNAFKLSAMVGDNFEIRLSQITKNTFKLQKSAFKLTTMVRENFEIHLF